MMTIGWVLFAMLLGVCWIQRCFRKKEWENGGEKKKWSAGSQ